MTKSNDEKSVVMAFQWRFHKYVIEKRHQNNVAKFIRFALLTQAKFLATPVLVRVEFINFENKYKL